MTYRAPPPHDQNPWDAQAPPPPPPVPTPTPTPSATCSKRDEKKGCETSSSVPKSPRSSSSRTSTRTPSTGTSTPSPKITSCSTTIGKNSKPTCSCNGGQTAALSTSVGKDGVTTEFCSVKSTQIPVGKTKSSSSARARTTTPTPPPKTTSSSSSSSPSPTPSVACLMTPSAGRMALTIVGKSWTSVPVTQAPVVLYQKLYSLCPGHSIGFYSYSDHASAFTVSAMLPQGLAGYRDCVRSAIQEAGGPSSFVCPMDCKKTTTTSNGSPSTGCPSVT